MKTKAFRIHVLLIFAFLGFLLPQTSSAAERENTLKSADTGPALGTVCYASREENELPPIPLPGPQKEKRGDADGNGEVNYMDALLVLRHSVGLENLSKTIVKRCDVDNSGALSYMDALLILRYSVGLESSL